jgi:hypothetical protein
MPERNAASKFLLGWPCNDASRSTRVLETRQKGVCRTAGRPVTHGGYRPWNGSTVGPVRRPVGSQPSVHLARA